jgi:O-antigen/teichoic acid export membrane protein
MIIGSALALGKFIVFAKLLSVNDFGLYSIFISLGTFAVFLFSFGSDIIFFNTGNKHLARNNDRKISTLYSKLLTFHIVWGCVYSAIVYLLIHLFFPLVNMQEQFSLIGLFSLNLILFNIGTTYFRIYENFVAFGAYIFLKGFVSLLVALILIDLYGVKGVISAEIISLIVINYFLVKRTGFSFLPVKNINRYTRAYLKSGAPFAFGYLMQNLSLNIDRWIISVYLGMRSVGLYSFSLIYLQAAASLMNIYSQVINAKFLKTIHKEKSYTTVMKEIRIINTYISIGFLLFYLVNYFMMDMVILKIFDQYIAARELILIVLFGVYFYLINIYEIILIASNKGTKISKINLQVLTFLILMYVIAWYMEYGLLFFGFIFVLSRAMNFILIFFEAKKIVKYGY